ncbi:retinol dehydrogenase 14-like isoform X2 [Culicoides brevitarsis]|uniref:retinol dehydrogenase 14-like isoform X2 n=1 Tax=Culicoides brevitarsis TaxID=469753 RepID=UPI00307C66D4
MKELLMQCSAIVLAILVILLMYRLYHYLTCGRFVKYKMTNMEGKVVIVTGANSGIGKETAKSLAKMGAKVIMACRNMETANQARDEIIKESENPKVILHKLDLSSQKSVRQFAAEILKTEPKLDVLLHNAGYANTFTKLKSEDGIELTMATNHYGCFLLTHLLIDLLRKSAPARIVIVASELYRFASVDLKNLNPVNTFPAYLYYVSKCANIMFGQELARRLEGSGITVNLLHPGMIDSGIWRNVPFPLSLPMNLIRRCFKTPEQGAQTSIYLASSPEVAETHGKYFMDCKEASLSKGIQNEERAKQLWEESVKIVGLSAMDPKI